LALSLLSLLANDALTLCFLVGKTLWVLKAHGRTDIPRAIAAARTACQPLSLLGVTLHLLIAFACTLLKRLWGPFLCH
tara:strand:- start:2076 stop:2309 length:234 start_codon:yes stop_codon:yes gene_type:complete